MEVSGKTVPSKKIKNKNVDASELIPVSVKGLEKALCNIKSSLTSHHGVTLVCRQIPSNDRAGCWEAGLGFIETAIDEGQRVQSLEMINRD